MEDVKKVGEAHIAFPISYSSMGKLSPMAKKQLKEQRAGRTSETKSKTQQHAATRG